MSEIDTLIAVIGTLGGTLGGLFLGYLLDERREAKRFSRETALQPLQERRSLLKEVHFSLVGLAFLAIRATIDQEFDGKQIDQAWHKFDTAIVQATLWISAQTWADISQAQDTIQVVVDQVVSQKPVSKKDLDSFVKACDYVVNRIRKELGADILENQFQEVVARLTRGHAI